MSRQTDDIGKKRPKNVVEHSIYIYILEIFSEKLTSIIQIRVNSVQPCITQSFIPLSYFVPLISKMA